MKNILNKEQIILLKKSGSILRDVLLEVKKQIKPGVHTKLLDEIAEAKIFDMGGTPSFKNYFVEGIGYYPAALCVSINEEIVHGIPEKDRVLKEGDIVSLDLGVNYKGICTDAAITVPVGDVSPIANKLIETTRMCLEKGIKAAHSGNRIGAIGYNVQHCAEKEGFSVVRDLVGHGVGLAPHTDPYIPNFGKKESGPAIEEGMALAIEPMITIGGYETETQLNNWVYVTKDRSLSAHFEHTVVIENGKPTIVT